MSSNFTPSDSFLNTLYSTGDFKAAADAYRVKEISDAVDTIYDKPGTTPKWQMASDEDISKLLKQKGGMSKFMSDAWNTIKGAASGPAARAIGNVAKVAGRTVLPVAATMATAQAINKGAEAYNAWQNKRLVDAEVANEAMAQQEMQKLIAQGFAPREALQMVRGLEVDQPSDYYKSVYGMSTTPQPTVVQQPAQNVAVNKPSSVEALINTKANPNVSYVQNPTTGEVVAVPAGENLIVAGDNNNGNNGNINNNATMVPSDNRAVELATQPQSQGSVSPAMANPTTPVQNALGQNILSSINRTPEERMKMADQLRQIYEQNMAPMMQGDPRYGGTVVTPENPYNVNMNEYANLQRLDQFRRAFGVDSNLAQQYADDAINRYQTQLANQTGVPYADYINATSEQRKLQLANAQAQIKAQADMIMQSDANMDKKLEAFTKLRDIEAQMEREVVGEELQRRRELEKAHTEGAYKMYVQDMINKGQLDLEKLKQQDPIEWQKARNGFYQSFNWASPWTQNLQMSNPELQKFFLGTVYSPEIINQAFPTPAQSMGLTQRQMPIININAGM